MPEVSICVEFFQCDVANSIALVILLCADNSPWFHFVRHFVDKDLLVIDLHSVRQAPSDSVFIKSGGFDIGGGAILPDLHPGLSILKCDLLCPAVGIRIRIHQRDGHEIVLSVKLKA